MRNFISRMNDTSYWYTKDSRTNDRLSFYIIWYHCRHWKED